METDLEKLAEWLPLGRGVRVLAANADGLVALDKPHGVLSHPNRERDVKRSLLRAGYDFGGECFSWGAKGEEPKRAWLVNRLDSPTSGIVLIALDEALAVQVKRQFATRRVAKVYYAMVRDAPKAPVGVWADELSKSVKSGHIRVKAGRRVKAKTRYVLLKTFRGGFPVALLKLMPVTGRTHQLRVQCKKHGHPIVGDQTYGSFSFNREVTEETGVKRMLLHSGQIELRYPFKGKVSAFEAESELPEVFGEVSGFRLGLMEGKLRVQRSAR